MGDRAEVGGYDGDDLSRFVPESHSGRRSDFARDRARIVHSSGLRRLAAKTQVLSPTAGLDFARTRLTHSLEVAQIGRELAARLGADPDVVDAACLAHDIGHPPFGHNGERALDSWAGDIGGFEGNAQTLRLLTRLEPKVFTADGRSVGLNLTRATLDATSKYPWSAGDAPRGSGARVKFGYYPEDAEVFAWVRAASPERTLCIEAQIMDLSDDIAYSVHDFEDAIVAGYLDVADLGLPTGHDRLVASMADWIGDGFTLDRLSDALERLRRLDVWIEDWDGSRAAQGRLKNLTSQLIGRFAGSAVDATGAQWGSGGLRRYAGAVVLPDDVRAEIAALKGVVAVHVMTEGARQPVYRRQRDMLLVLAEHLAATAPETLEPGFAADWTRADGADARRRVIVDQLASLTDQSALSWFESIA